MTDKIGIYLHIPFCISKCHYCDFCSVSRADEGKKQAYVDAICREINAAAEEIRGKHGRVPVADTVYFGGGTPSLLTPKQFEMMLAAVESNWGIVTNAEITAEANPKTVDGQRLCDMRSLGINRLSIGMQSTHDSELRALGRPHSFADFTECYKDARGAGFDNISLDLMYGIPNQTPESFYESVRRTAELSPEHISSYCLTIEEGTNFHRRRDSLILPDEDEVANMYLEMGNILSRCGYNKYEISNFSREGKESRHNLKYWQRDDYLGFGPGAHSFFDGVRVAHSRDIEAYIRGESILEKHEKIGEKDAEEEFIFLGMRLEKGIDTEEYKTVFKTDFYKKYGKRVRKYAPEYIDIGEKYCRFTDKGMFVSNYILADILDE